MCQASVLAALAPGVARGIEPPSVDSSTRPGCCPRSARSLMSRPPLDQVRDQATKGYCRNLAKCHKGGGLINRPSPPLQPGAPLGEGA